MLDWADIARSLREVDYGGWLMLELGCPDGGLREYFRRAVVQGERLLGV
jgi:sugar phosphate isomerase/epimerase